MSGPRDEPRDPGSGWPLEDFDSARSSAIPSAGQPEGASDGWDDWPPITPPAGDYGAADPILPTSDPWAESWDDDPSVGSSSSPIDQAERYEAHAPYEPRAPYEPPPTRYDPSAHEPAAETEWIPPEPDPPSPPPPVEEEWAPDPTREAGGATAESEWVPPEPEPVASWSSRPWRPDTNSEWMAEPAEAAPLPPFEAPPEPEPIPEPEPEPEPIPEPEPEPEPIPEPEPEPEEVWAPPPTPERVPEEQREPVYGGVDEPTQVFPTSWAPPPSPQRDGELDPAAGSVRTSFAPGGGEASDAVAVERPAVAEQAVPWLIGAILLLAGMVIVLLALIFAGDASLGGAAASPSGDLPSGIGGSAEPSPSLLATPRPSTAAATGSPTPTAVPAPEYGAIEVVYQGRSAALEPINLLRRDFAVEEVPSVLTQDPRLNVRKFAWAPDGTVGAALLADTLVTVEPGAGTRSLGEDIATATFVDDASTLYAVRVVQAGVNDVATILAVGFVSGNSTEVAELSYARPQIEAEPALQEARFADEGGTVRIFWMDDDTIRLWILGAGVWSLDPETGELTQLDGEVLPVLWAPDGRHRIELTESGTSTTLELLDADGAPVANSTLDVLVSHVRWSRDSRRVVFTGGESADEGGVLQDLWLWDPEEGTEPRQLTNTGAAFGAEWLGAQPRWRAQE